MDTISAYPLDLLATIYTQSATEMLHIEGLRERRW